MRKRTRTDLIVIHCSATKEGDDVTFEDLERGHKARGFSMIGYHLIVFPDGTAVQGRADDVMGAHAKGYNGISWSICYVGGLDKNGNPKDTRTDAQKKTLKEKVEEKFYEYRDAKVVGHRDLSKDLDGDGIIEKHEWMKQCPCFDVQSWFKKEILCE